MAILQQVFPVQWSTAATNLSLSSSLEMPGAFQYVYLSVPTMSAGYSVAATPLYLQVSHDNVTFRRYAEVNTSTVTNDFIIASALSSRVVYIPAFAARYVKLEMSGTVTNPTGITSSFAFICVHGQ